MRILMVSTTAIGDTVMATPFIRAVRQRYPEARITVFAHRRRMAVLEHNPHFNVLLPYFGKGRRLPRTLWALRREGFDLAIVLHANDPDIVPLVRWSGAPQRVGWAESKWAGLFTHTIRRTQLPEHFMLHKKRLLESVGITVDDLHTELFLQPADETAFQQRLLPWLQKTPAAGRYVVMHPFGANSAKWWLLDGFFDVAQHILEKYGWPAVFIGDDASLATVKRHPRFDSTRHFAAIGCGIRESAFIIHKARRMLTTDSGPMHLAFAVRCPALCLFGPTQPAIHGPCFDLDLHCVLHRDPLASLPVADVVRTWDQFGLDH
ncbi:MAG: glycosyltransferase family 9 protein [Verrucomicrobia bacterium]|nr:glycosyltransferase family 9 protein [Verrucomicrobiota bacterium]